MPPEKAAPQVSILLFLSLAKLTCAKADITIMIGENRDSTVVVGQGLSGPAGFLVFCRTTTMSGALKILTLAGNVLRYVRVQKTELGLSRITWGYHACLSA